jgi:hypothetical protein
VRLVLATPSDLLIVLTSLYIGANVLARHTNQAPACRSEKAMLSCPASLNACFTVALGKIYPHFVTSRDRHEFRKAPLRQVCQQKMRGTCMPGRRLLQSFKIFIQRNISALVNLKYEIAINTWRGFFATVGVRRTVSLSIAPL